ncbi:MAG: Brex phage defense system component BrxB [Phormidesmis priestleyi Ana]|uniref:Brex phage defense system component BrxB n=1 Tax=Phormidesmis priestleyi Ana TaxID=1666911 RepID=A0A0P7ZCQ8_9CYAN|nr:MAG: Brex phage defense system component BrxB [Phormidesmis priestleyi Ana]
MAKKISGEGMHERFKHLQAVISGKRFLSKQGLGNEIPFFICPFNSKEAAAMDRTRQGLIKSLSIQGVEVLDINLYDLAIELLKAREIWEQILALEETVPKEQLKELLQGVLDPEAHVVPAIAQKITDKKATTGFDVLFISGIGEVFPYIRSHNVLNNLQSTAKDQPTVLFFPGEYTQSLESGASLDLFGKLQDDKYYRAFNIDDYEV